MSMAENAESFSAGLQVLPKNMRIFALCLRSLYAEHVVGSSANNATGINKIRDEMRQEAIVYFKGILPLSTQLVRYVQGLFEYYEVLELDEWKENLPEILEEVNAYQQCSTEIVRMHKEMMVPLKKRQSEARMLICELHGINKELDKNIAQLKKDAAKSDAWALGLVFVPFVGLVASPLLCASAADDRAKALAESKQLSINQAAVVVASKILYPALCHFIHGLETTAGFINVMKEELTSLRSRGIQTERANLHHEIMKKKALEVKELCRRFHAMLPGVETDLQCIPEQPGDRIYYNERVTTQLGEITRNCNQTATANMNTLLSQAM